jgi:hypothetical protein
LWKTLDLQYFPSVVDLPNQPLIASTAVRAMPTRINEEVRRARNLSKRGCRIGVLESSSLSRPAVFNSV